MAILPVDILGHPCDLPALKEIAEQYGLAMIEDATESLGALCGGRPLGQWSRLTCFSFNGNKVMTTGGGGMLVTDDPDLAQRARYLTTQAKDDPVEFVHHEIGYNYRLTSVQAALGCAQLERLSGFVADKRRIAALYDEAFRDVPGIQPMKEAPWATASYWMYTILVDPDSWSSGWRGRSACWARSSSTSTPAKGRRACWTSTSPGRAGPCPTASRLNRLALSLPCSTGLTEQEQRRVIAAVRHEIIAHRQKSEPPRPAPVTLTPSR